MAEEIVIPTLYFAYAVCQGKDVDAVLATMDAEMARRVLRWARLHGYVRRKGQKWVPTERLCKQYEAYLKCYQDNIVYCTNPQCGLDVLYTCLAMNKLT